MRLLHVADRLSDRGGAYTYLLAIAAELARAHDVTLAVGRRDIDDAPRPVVECPGLDSRTDEPVPELAALVAREPFDVMHVHNVMNPAVLGWAAGTGRALSAEPDGQPCVAFVGRLADSKGIGDAIAAWRQSGVDLPLVLAGTGPMRHELERAGFEVLGWLDRASLSGLYRCARAVLMPSRWQEPFGIVGPEAAGHGHAGRCLGQRRHWGVAPGRVGGVG